MPKVLTKTDIEFNEFRIVRELQEDNTYKWFLIVAYNIKTQEGEIINRDWQTEITGALKITISNFFDNLVSKIRTREGL